MTRARMFATGLLVMAAALAVAACGSSGGSAARGPTTTASTAPRPTTSTAPAQGSGRPTTWRDDTAHWKQLVPAPISKSPAQVADDLAAAYRGGDTSEVGQVSVQEVRTGEPLVVVLSESGVSDGIPGRDIEITLEPGDEGWAVSSARVRDRCVEVAESNPAQCV